MTLFELFKRTPEAMRAKLMDDARILLVEAEHMETRWKHIANNAREEIERLSAVEKTAISIASATYKARVKPEISTEDNALLRSFIGQPK